MHKFLLISYLTTSIQYYFAMPDKSRNILLNENEWERKYATQV